MLQAGQIVDNYRLDELIHRGRGTLVFAATDLALRRRVAFKVLAGTSASDPRARDRFVREAQTAAALDANPHIVTVYRWGQVEDSLYFVTEFVVGISMEELVERQPGGEGLTVVEAVALLGQVGGAVDFAHRRGVVHRDIKPANIMVRMTETPLSAYLIDFGITKLDSSGLDQAGLDRGGIDGSGVGDDGGGDAGAEPPALVGTPDYVAPEVIAGEPVDWRADIYSFGCTAFEMLSGAPPFADAPHDAARLAAHLGTPVTSITAVRPSLPAGFDPVFRRVLAKQAEDRYGSCQEFVAALAAELPAEAHEYARPTVGGPAGGSGEEPPLTAYAVTKRRRWPWLLATVVLVAGAFTAGWVLTAGLRDPDVEVAIGRNAVLPTTTTTTSTTTTSTTTTTPTTTTTTEPPPPTGLYGDVVGQPVAPPGLGSAESNFALAVQSRVFDAATIAAPDSLAAYYADWARLIGPPGDVGDVVATETGYLVVVGEQVEINAFEADVSGLPMTLSECVGDACHSLEDPATGMAAQPTCQVGVEGCSTTLSSSGRLAAVRVAEVNLRAPEYSAMFRLEPPPPAAPVGTEPPPTAPPLPQVQAIFNADGSARYLANGEFFVVTFPQRPAAGAVETLTVTYADGSQDELELRF